MSSNWFYLPIAGTEGYLSDTQNTQVSNARLPCKVTGDVYTVSMPTITLKNSINVSQTSFAVTMSNVYNATPGATFALTSEKMLTISPVDLAPGGSPPTFNIQYSAISNGSQSTQTSPFVFDPNSVFFKPAKTDASQIGNWYRFAYSPTTLQNQKVLEIVEPVQGNGSTVVLLQNAGGEEPTTLQFTVPLEKDVPGFTGSISVPNVPAAGSGGETYVRVFYNPTNPDAPTVIWKTGIAVSGTGYGFQAPITAPGKYALAGDSSTSGKYVFASMPAAAITQNGYNVQLQVLVDGVTAPEVITLSNALNSRYKVCVDVYDADNPSAPSQELCVPGSNTKPIPSTSSHVRDSSKLVFSVKYMSSAGTYDTVLSTTTQDITYTATKPSTDTVVGTLDLGNNVSATVTLSAADGAYVVDAQTPIGTQQPKNYPPLPSRPADNTTYAYFQNALIEPIQYGTRSNDPSIPLSLAATLAPNAIGILGLTTAMKSLVARTADGAFTVEIPISVGASSVQNGVLTLQKQATPLNSLDFYQLTAETPYGYTIKTSAPLPSTAIALVLVNLSKDPVDVTLSSGAVPSLTLRGQPRPVVSADMALENAQTTYAYPDSKLTASGKVSFPLSALLKDAASWATDTFFGVVDTKSGPRPVVTIYVRDPMYYVIFTLKSDNTSAACPAAVTLETDVTQFQLQTTAVLRFANLKTQNVTVVYNGARSPPYSVQQLFTPGFVSADKTVAVTSSKTSTTASMLPSIATVDVQCVWEVQFSVDVDACSTCSPNVYAATVIQTATNVQTLVRQVPVNVVFRSSDEPLTICTNNNSQKAWSTGTVADLLAVQPSSLGVPLFPPNMSTTGQNDSYIAVTNTNPLQVTIYCSCGTYGKMCGSYVPPSGKNNNNDAQPPSKAPASSSPASSPASATDDEPSSSNNTVVIAVIAAGVLLLVAAVIALVVVYKRRK